MKIYLIYKADTRYYNIDAFLRAGAERSEAPASFKQIENSVKYIKESIGFMWSRI